jgi:hypothetical protein
MAKMVKVRQLNGRELELPEKSVKRDPNGRPFAILPNGLQVVWLDTGTVGGCGAAAVQKPLPPHNDVVRPNNVYEELKPAETAAAVVADQQRAFAATPERVAKARADAEAAKKAATPAPKTRSAKTGFTYRKG